jgi:hypothetical protein
MKTLNLTACMSLGLAALVTFVAGCASAPKATDAKASASTQRSVDKVQAPDASGTWSWTPPGSNGDQPPKLTLTLMADGEHLTGNVQSPPRREGAKPRFAEISDGRVGSDQISFKVIRESAGNTITMKYSGKVSGDTIKGTVQLWREGETPQSRDWEAKREK